MSACQYFHNGTLLATGMPEIKQWLFDGGLERLLPNENAPKLVGQVDGGVRFNKSPVESRSLKNDYKERIDAMTDFVSDARQRGMRVTKNDGNGSVTMYHGTSNAYSDKIQREGKFNQSAWFSNSKSATIGHSKPKYGKENTILTVQIDPRDLEMTGAEGEFYAPDGLVFNKEDGLWQSPKRYKQAKEISEPKYTLNVDRDSFYALHENKGFAHYIYNSLRYYFDQNAPANIDDVNLTKEAKAEIQDWIDDFESHPRKASTFAKQQKMTGAEFISALKDIKGKIKEEYLKKKENDSSESSDAIYSKTTPKTTGSTVTQVKSWLPKQVTALMNAGKLKVMQSVNSSLELFKYNDNGIEGYYDPKADVIYLIADNISQKNVNSVVSHELVHRAETTDPLIQRALNRLESSIQTAFDNAAKGIGSANDLAAYQRVIEAQTAKKDQLSEFIAYKVTEFLSNPANTTPTIANAIKRWLSAIKVFLVRNGLDMGFVRSLNESDFAAMSRYGARVNELQGNTQNDVVALASKSGYEGNDKGEAFEWLRAVAKGLDMSKEARMARAKEMGFDVDTVWYHGTGSDFREFNSGNAVYTANDKSSKSGAFFSNDANVASSFADNRVRGRVPNVLPVFLKYGKVKKYTTPPDLLKYRILDKEISDLENEIYEKIDVEEKNNIYTNISNAEINKWMNENNVTITPINDDFFDRAGFNIVINGELLVSDKNIGDADFFYTKEDAINFIKSDVAIYDFDIPEYEKSNIIKQLENREELLRKERKSMNLDSDYIKNNDSWVKFTREANNNEEPEYGYTYHDVADFDKLREDFINKGIDSVLVKDTMTDAENNAPSDQIIILNPNQIRSIFAAFDPDFADSPNLLASTNDQELESLVKQYASESGAPTRAEMTEALRQYREVEQKYFNADGTPKDGAMLSPSGKPTNLNKVQWIQVRTENFKKFFGNWEDFNDTDVSIVTDRNDEPKVVYHFTGSAFTEFDKNKTDGFWFTDRMNDENTGASNSGDIISAFINLREPETNGRNYDVETAADDGYDGVEIKFESETHYAVIEPNQIKSATGQVGTFSAGSNDIRFSRRLEDIVESSLPKETTVQEKRRQFQDAALRFKVLQEDLEIRTAHDNGYSGNNVYEAREFLIKNRIENPINDQSNYYLAQSTTEGIATEEIKDFQNDVMQPLIKESGKAKIQMTDISDYMLMRYALTNPDLGISTADANAKITEFQLRPDFDKLKSLADRWQSQVAVMNAKLIAAGLPAKLTSLPIDIPTQKSGESDTSFALRLKRTVQSQNVIENILHDYEKSVYAIEHNKIALSAVELIRQANDPEIGILNPSKLPAEGKFTYFVAGEKRQAQFNDPLLARAYKEKGINEVGAILNQGRIINTYLSTVYTAYSPTFLIKNPIRDAIQGFVTNTGNFGFDMAKEIFTAYPTAAKELYNHFKNHGSSSVVNLYRKSGGSTGAAYMSDRERIGLDIMSSYNEYAGAVDTYNRTYQEAISAGKSKPMALAIAAKRATEAGIKETPFIGHFLRFMENANAITENSLRLATFNTLIKHGYSEKQAAGYAKDLMNFNRKGELGAQVSALWLFANPSFQGSQVMMSTLAGSKYKGQAQILTGTIMLMAFLIAESMRGGDDDEEQKWKTIPKNLKDRNIIFNTPFTDMPLMLPVPYGYGVFHVLGNAISDVMHGENTYKASLHVASSMIDNFSPFGNPMNSEHAAFQLMPTLPKMMLSPSINENNFSAPIQPEKWKKAKPDSQNMYRGTKGSFFATSSEFLNDISGGNKYQAGMIDVSPEVLKFWNSSILGGSGQFFADSVGLGNILLEGSEPNIKDIPVVKAFAHEISVQDSRRAFWESANEAQLASDQFAAAKSKHDKSMMIAIKSESGDLIALAKTAKKAQKMASKYRDAIDAIRFDDSLTLDEKRTKQKELEDKEAMVYTRFLSVFDKKTKNE